MFIFDHRRAGNGARSHARALLLSTTAVVTMSLTPALAQDAGTTVLEGITIYSANRTPTDAAKVGSSVEVLTEKDLEKQSRRNRIALVGHEPGIGELAARLIGSQHPLEFTKAAVCRIDVNRLPPSEPGFLRWFVSAKMLRSLNKDIKR